MNFFLSIGKILFCFSCISSCSFLESEDTDYEKTADKITHQTAKKLNSEKSLVLAGTGGQMMNDIQMMMMGFNFYKAIDIQNARKLLVDSVEEYLSAINTNDQIRKYLHNYPFTPENIEIAIYFYNPDGSKVSDGKIKIADARRNKIIYYIDSLEDHTITPVHEETYEEAKLKILLENAPANSDKEICEESYGEAKRKINPPNLK